MPRKCYESSQKNRRGTYAITVQEREREWIAESEVINERRPGPAAEVQEREIKGKNFKLDTSLGNINTSRNPFKNPFRNQRFSKLAVPNKMAFLHAIEACNNRLNRFF